MVTQNLNNLNNTILNMKHSRPSKRAKTFPTQNEQSYQILFGNRYPVPDTIMEYCGISTIFWLRLCYVLFGGAYFDRLVEDWRLHYFSDKPRDCFNMVLSYMSATRLIRRIARNNKHHIRRPNELNISRVNRTALTLMYGDILPSCPSGVHAIASSYEVLFFNHGERFVDVPYHSFLGLYYIPQRFDCRHNQYDRLIFDDHMQSILQAIKTTSRKIGKRNNPFDTKFVVRCASMTMTVDKHIPYNAFHYNPLEHDRTLSPTHRVCVHLVQDALLFLMQYHHALCKSCSISPLCSDHKERSIRAFLPYIEMIIRVALVRNSLINFRSFVPSTPWTLAIAYFTMLPTPIGFAPLVEAYYTYQTLNKFNIIWNTQSFSDIMEVLTFWSSTLQYVSGDDSSFPDDICDHPLHSPVNFAIFNAVCSSLFVNVFRSVVVGMLEPFMVETSSRDIHQLRLHHKIYDFDELSEDTTVFPTMQDTFTMNPMVTMIGMEHIRERFMQTMRQLSRIVLVTDETKWGTPAHCFPTSFTYTFPDTLSFNDPRELDVIVGTSSNTLKEYLRYLLHSNFTHNQLPIGESSTVDMIEDTGYVCPSLEYRLDYAEEHQRPWNCEFNGDLCSEIQNFLHVVLD